MTTTSNRFPSEAFGYLLGVEVYRSREVHITLPNLSEPKVRFPGVPDQFLEKLVDATDRQRQIGQNYAPPTLPLSTVIARLGADLTEIIIYAVEGMSRNWIAELIERDGVTRRDIRDISKRSVVTSQLACREIGNHASGDSGGEYLIEMVQKSTPEEYLEALSSA